MASPAKKAGGLMQQTVRRYSLCKLCARRNGGLPRTSAGRCEICRGLMTDVDAMADRIFSVVRNYDFSTFLVGAVLPTQIYEREDALRARLKIRGLESVKSQLTRELGLRVASGMSGKRVDYLRPDLTISIVVDKDNSSQVSARARPLVFAGRYMKRTRGVPQKQSRCPACEGKGGCTSCNDSGLSGYESVEGIIAKRLIEATGGKTPRFSWAGSEDRESLVLGRGRPFIVQVFDPRWRTFARRLRAAGAGVSAVLASSSRQTELSETPRFSVKTRILIRCEREVFRADLAALEKSLSGLQVSFESRSRVTTKKIYSALARKNKDGSFYLYVELDGGLGIKQFVAGGSPDYYSSSLSQLIGAKCECVTFDILSVTFLSSERLSGRE